jgi:cholesterol transport system auxiliary component
MKRRVLLLAPLALSACGGLLPTQKYIPRVNWPLDPAPPAQLPANPSGPVLMVRTLSAAPGLDQLGLQSLAPDGSLVVDAYNLWAADPAAAATQALINWLQASGAFSAVVSPGSRLTPDFIVEGELTELLADPAAGRARAVVTLVVIKPAGSVTGAALPIAQRRITGTAPLAGGTPAAQAAAQNAALADALARAVAVVRAP